MLVCKIVTSSNVPAACFPARLRICTGILYPHLETKRNTWRHDDTETQRHGDTARFGHSEVWTQRHRDTETQRHRDTETQRQFDG